MRSWEELFRTEIAPALWRRMRGFLKPAALQQVPMLYRHGELFTTSGDFVLVPHTDNRWYLLTVIVYFPADGDHEPLGTQLFSAGDQTAVNPQYLSPHLRKTVPYRRNTLVCLPNTPASFHGTPPLGDYHRNTYINYVTGEPNAVAAIFSRAQPGAA